MFLHFARRAAVFVFCAVALAASTVMAKRGSVAPAVNGSVASGGSNCTVCHGGGGGVGSVQIIGAPSAYTSGGIYDLTVRVSDAAQAGAGFQLSVENGGGSHVGTLSLLDAVRTTFNTGDANWVNHTSAGVDDSVANWVANGGSVDYSVRWEAPGGDAGVVTFFAAGNAINDNSSLTGDNVYTTSQTAGFASVPAVSDWGVLAMLLLLLTSGTLVLRRRAAEIG
jgi:hypothetical protein